MLVKYKGLQRKMNYITLSYAAFEVLIPLNARILIRGIELKAEHFRKFIHREQHLLHSDTVLNTHLWLIHARLLTG